MKKFGKLLDFKKKGNKVYFTFENGDGRIEILTDRIVNVFSGFMCEEHVSKAIEGDKAKKTSFTCGKEGNAAVIRTAFLTVKVYSGFKVDFYRYDGKTLSRDYRGKMESVIRMSDADLALMAQEGHRIERADFDKKINVVRAVDRGECLMGLGDKAGFMDKTGYEYIMWNTDTTNVHDEQMGSIYKSVPFFLSKKKNGAVYGMFFDNTFRSVFNMAKDSPDYMWYGVDDGNLDYYFMAGEDLPEIVGLYTYLTGTTPLPQRWTLGYHQCRWGYVDENDYNYITNTMRESGVPCDVIYLDIDYMERYKIFSWNGERYHDAKKTLAAAKKKGFKTVTIIDPAIKIEKGYGVFEEGLEKGYFATDQNGLPCVNTVWPGESLYPDFGNPEVREWWGDNLRFNLDHGVAGIWNDMNEPASFRGELPQDIVFHDGDRATTHAEMHNVYGHYMSQATYEGLKKATGKRPFVITRACYAGTQKYSTVWTGDNRSVWLHLRVMVPQLCTLGLCGISFCGTDIGGFMQDTTPELLTRWIEAACFSPLFRNHCNKGNRYQEPWRFGEETLEIYKKYVKLHYAFIPYMYDLFWKGEKNGLPVMRPLALHYENDRKALRCNSQYMVGDQLMMAPVLDQGAEERMVYLPRGDWFDMNTGKKIKGGRSFVASAPIDVCPMYAKAGAIFPNYEEMNYVGEKPLDTLILKVFPGEGEYVHYEDNGEDFNYRDGEYNEYKFTLSGGKLCGELIYEGYGKKYKKFVIDCLGKKTVIKAQKKFEVEI